MSRLSSQLRFNDLTGGINNVYDKEMINSSTKKTETPDMVNVEYFQLGGIKTMEGNTLVGGDNSIQGSAIIGGWEYTKGNNKYMIIGLANGEVRRYDESIQEGNQFELIYSFPSTSDRMSFCNMNNGVIITNGIDDLVFYEENRNIVLSGNITASIGDNLIIGNGTKFLTELKIGDGILIYDNIYYVKSIDNNTELHLDSNVTDLYIEGYEIIIDEQTGEEITIPIYKDTYRLTLGNTSLCNATLINTNTDVDTTGLVNVPIRGLAIQYYKGRLYIGTEQGLFYSPIGEYNNWDIKDDAGVFYDIYNDSSEVTALGLYSDYMLVHKKFNTYVLSDNGSGKASESLSINPFSNITCDSQQSWIVSNTKYYIYSKEFMDIYPLVQRTIYNDRFLGEPITQKVRELFKDVKEYDTKNIFCVSRPKQRQMVFYMPTNNVSGSGEALIFDFQTKSWLLRRLPKATNVTCAFNFDNNIYIGTNDGLVLKEFTGNNFTIPKQTTKIIEIERRLITEVDTNIEVLRFEAGEYNHFVALFNYNGRIYRVECDFAPSNLSDNDVFDIIISDKHHITTSGPNGEIEVTDMLIEDVSLGEYIESYGGHIYRNSRMAISYNDIVEEEVEVLTTEDEGLHAYYKSPWFDWAGNYYQSFAEFFIEVNSNYKNRFIIRTQKDGTSRYEDRQIDENKFVDKTNTLVWDDESKHWGGVNQDTDEEYKHDNWGKITFDTLRMLLPNSIFESFQFELKADNVGDGFHIYQYGFRRIETEEAPW